MALEEVFAAYAPRLATIAGLAFVGPGQVDDNAKHPRISWNPKRANHLAPKETGVILTRQIAIEVEVWGGDLTQTEYLLHRFIATTHDLCSRFSYGFGSEEWLTGGSTASGCVCKLTLLLQVPVLKTEPASKPVNFQVTHTMGETQV
jgi:hypothetical protein